MSNVQPTATCSAADPSADLEALFVGTLPEIEAAARAVGRRFRLSPHEVEDFASVVKLKMVENGYRVLARFEGRSSFRTYVQTVVARQFLDLHRKEQGRWRASARALRLGVPAVNMERLMYTQGLSAEQAIREVSLDPKCLLPHEELARIAQTLPPRAARPRRRPMCLDEMGGAEVATDEGTPEEQLVSSREGDRAGRAIEAAMARVSAQELRVLRMRFELGLTVADIARTLGLNARRLYRSVDSALRRLRGGIEEQGLQWDELAPVLASGRLELRWPKEARIPARPRPAQPEPASRVRQTDLAA